MFIHSYTKNIQLSPHLYIMAMYSQHIYHRILYKWIYTGLMYQSPIDGFFYLGLLFQFVFFYIYILKYIIIYECKERTTLYSYISLNLHYILIFFSVYFFSLYCLSKKKKVVPPKYLKYIITYLWCTCNYITMIFLWYQYYINRAGSFERNTREGPHVYFNIHILYQFKNFMIKKHT